MGAFPTSHILNSTQLALPESPTQIRLTAKKELDDSASIVSCYLYTNECFEGLKCRRVLGVV